MRFLFKTGGIISASFNFLSAVTQKTYKRGKDSLSTQHKKRMLRTDTKY